MFDRQKSVEYAHKWWNKRNPSFFNFDELGGDCTNFVSQCLFFGGIAMNYNALGWFYASLNSRSPSWTGVDEFFDFATKNNSNFGVMAKLSRVEELEIGDVVQLKLFGENNFHHTMLVTKKIGFEGAIDVFVTCHTFDAKDKCLADYNAKEYRFLKILN